MFPSEIKERAMIACARRCCLCHKFCGVGMECHHIVESSKGGANTYENCIPLCFDCHAEVGHYSNEHPKGTKFMDYSILPQSEFFNFHMETALADLKKSIRKYKESCMNRVWWEHDGTAGVPREWRYRHEESAARFDEAVEIMNKEASLVWNAFSVFIKEGRRQLQVDLST